MDIKRATYLAVTADLLDHSFPQLEKALGVNRGLLWRVSQGIHSPTVAEAYDITSEPPGAVQWKARISPELHAEIQQIQKDTGLTYAQLLDRWVARELSNKS